MGVARRERWAVPLLWAALLAVALLGGGVVRGFEDGAAVYIVTMKQAPVSHKRLDLARAEKLNRRKEVANIMLDFSVRTATTYTPEFLGLPEGAWVQDGGPQCAGQGVVVGLIDTGIDPNHPSFADDLTTDNYPVPAHYSGNCEVTSDFPSGSCNRKLVGARHFAASAITRGVFNASQDLASPSDSDGHGTCGKAQTVLMNLMRKEKSVALTMNLAWFCYVNAQNNKLLQGNYFERPLSEIIISEVKICAYSHTASIAAGNHGIPVIVAGHHFGNASGMAPRAHIAVYKALYKGFGGFAADVVAAIDQAAEDNVDIISLSITPNRRPPGLATFFNPIDMALMSAVKDGIFVVQAAGNTGPSPKSMSSYSPWIFTVGASAHDREYNNYVVLGNNLTISGVGLAPGTDGDSMYNLIAAPHALQNYTTTPIEMSLGECQDPSHLDKDLIRGKILVCSYSIRFVLGLSSVKQALDTAKNVSAAGIIFYLDPFVLGFQLNPTPMDIPGLIIPSSDDSKIFLSYYNDSLVRDGTSDKVVNFGAVAKILGGLKPNYGSSAPKVMFYSARGPDPEDNTLANADILKPNVVAPGSSIWGAWSSRGLDSAEFTGESFAMLSGTSMAAPHIAGLAALIKQKFPSFSPAAIGSALSTTTTLSDKQGNPIMSQRTYSNPDSTQTPATPFDMGSGFANATAALDPGLIFDCSYDDYLSFLCGINGSAPVVANYTGNSCGASTMTGADLNLPSITIAVLNQSRTVTRTVTNVASDENYTVSCNAPYGVAASATPAQFFIPSGQKQLVTFVVNATMTNSSVSFGDVEFYGDKGHRVVIPFTVMSKAV
ncbi:Subtilisin-like protease [Triticum urartu]|uniref:Subtilisin-like protease n=1 Tax=Triticum urartu TaxID=4572 RepID=M7YNR3_TRIUA|nr:Subtilisin-like protease [Triticum urartu]